MWIIFQVSPYYTNNYHYPPGNYLSLRGEHEKAVVHFQRALKLNPKFVSAYTLMGYEYMEMKNTIQAIQCYRNALSECHTGHTGHTVLQERAQ